MNILESIDNPEVFAPSFKDPTTWDAWRAFLAVLFGLTLTPEQLEIYRQCTGRQQPPTNPIHEAWLVVGRRGGKSFILALVAVFLACFRDWKPHLGPGERGTIMVIAQDRKQATHILNFVHGLLHDVPMLKALIEHETQESIVLSNRIVIEVHSCNYRSVRGYTVVAALLDELAVWRGEDAANPDVEVIASIRPAMGTIPEAVMLCASSPISRKGELWEAYRRHFGKDDDPTLVWHAPTKVMNPSYSQAVIDAALERDPVRNRAEYLVEWRSDIEGFVMREAIEACVDFGIRERPPVRGIRYNAFTDLAGGGPDSFTLAVAHINNGIGIQDCLREVRGPSANPSVVIDEFAGVLKSYGITQVRGDNYAKEWPIEVFAKHGIKYLTAGKFKSDIYLEVLPLINSAKVRLLDHTKMINQWLDLDRTTARGGRESIDHPKGGHCHDDLANSTAGALLWATKKRPQIRIGYGGPGGPCINGRNIFYPDEEPKPRLRIVNVDELGEEISSEEAQARRHEVRPRRSRA